MIKNKSKPKPTWYRHSLKINGKNQLLFYRKLRSDRMFYAQLTILLEKYGNFKNSKDASDLLYSFIDPSKRYQLDPIYKQIYLVAKAFHVMERWTEKRCVEFLDEIDHFLKKFNFGFEWMGPLFAIILEHRLCLPYENLYINYSWDDDPDSDDSLGRVILTLNPDTSLEDIKFVFDRIKKMQKKLQPNFKSINLTRDALKRFYEVMYYDLAKYIEAVKENRKQLKDGYEKIIYDSGIRNNSINEAVKTINKRNYAVSMRKPRFKYHQLSADKIVAQRIASVTDKRTNLVLNNIRQKRKRQKA